MSRLPVRAAVLIAWFSLVVVPLGAAEPAAGARPHAQGAGSAPLAQAPAKPEAPGVLEVVVRLLFGARTEDRQLLAVLNQGRDTPAITGQAFLLNPASGSLTVLDTPAAARSILVHEAGDVFFVVDRKVLRMRMSAPPGLPNPPREVNFVRPMPVEFLLGFIDGKADEVLAVSAGRELVRLGLATGEVLVVRENLTEAEASMLACQSLNPRGQSLVFANDKGDLLLFPKGLQSRAGRPIGGKGFKVDPRWSSDGVHVAFVRATAP